MVRIVILLIMLIFCFDVNAQKDTLNCKRSFAYYDSLFGKNPIVIWDVPPSIKEKSKRQIETIKDLVKDINKKYLTVDIIIDATGQPICFRFSQKLCTHTKEVLKDKLNQLQFNPAIQRKKRVRSIYTLKL